MDTADCARERRQDRPPAVCEVSVDGALSGAENMRRDEAMLARAAQSSDVCMVRAYRWSEPTVSLGYFQRTDAPVDSRLANCLRVRRLTGGGAILHDDEITYSCALPASHPICRDPIQLYVRIHTAVIELLRECRVDCRLRGSAAASGQQRKDEPFLCFLRADPRDIVLGSHKITGSAQRRRRGSILQHGSVLLRASRLVPEIPGIADLVPEFCEAEFISRFPVAVAQAVAQKCRFSDFSGQL